MSEHSGDDHEPRRNFEEMLDLDRSTLIKNYIEQMERAYRDIEAAQDNLKAIAATALDHEFRKHDVAAMKKIAKLLVSDKVGDAREQLEALERIAAAVDMPLFAYASRAH
jgi:uncharacterized protein (UPF0335 family)